MRALAFVLWLAIGGGVDDGLRAYREGNFADAQHAFAEAETQAAGGASAELAWNVALAALEAGDLSAAESAAGRAASRGGARFAGLRDFLLGNVAFVRCERAEAVATRPEAEPFAFDAAIALAESARSRWQQAAASRSDWPEARRNVERALLKAKSLREKKRDAEDKKKKDPQESKGREDVERPEPKKEPEIAPQPPVAEVELTPEGLARLVDRLFEKEREKQRSRRETRARRTDVEKDW